MGILGKKLAFERLVEDLAKQKAITDDLAREVRGLQLEYIELYDKVRHQMSRMAKRAAVDNRETIIDEVIEPADDGVDPISAQILALRGEPRKKA